MPSDPQSFFIDVPAGPAKQHHCSIFERPRGPGWAQETPYGISLHESLLPEGLIGVAALKAKDMSPWGGEPGRWLPSTSPTSTPKANWIARELIPEWNWFGKKVSGRLHVRSISSTADWLGAAFNDLKWVGMTADQVVRFLPKRLLVKRYDGLKDGQRTAWVTLEAVGLRDVDIINALDQATVQEFVDVE